MVQGADHRENSNHTFRTYNQNFPCKHKCPAESETPLERRFLFRNPLLIAGSET
jgi:hypothetical protein